MCIQGWESGLYNHPGNCFHCFPVLGSLISGSHFFFFSFCFIYLCWWGILFSSFPREDVYSSSCMSETIFIQSSHSTCNFLVKYSKLQIIFLYHFEGIALLTLSYLFLRNARPSEFCTYMGAFPFFPWKYFYISFSFIFFWYSVIA